MRTTGRLVLIACALAGVPQTAQAQFPAELSGRVVERGTSRPIDGAVVEVVGAASTATDASGAFSLRSAEGGPVTIVVTHAGYAPLRTSATLESGRTAMLVFQLEPVVAIEPLTIVAAPEPGFVVTREQIAASGARTLGELLRDAPAVVVRDVAGGGARLSIRGGAPDEVLVLVDGVPANDPLTGEADVSAIGLQGVESVRVLPGALSARHGGRAATGVVLVESSVAHSPTASAVLLGGSLGRVGAAAEASAPVGPAAVAFGVRVDHESGEFGYRRSEALGGGDALRTNADERVLGGFAAVEAPLAGRVEVRADVSRHERGLPGPMHAPTPEARQHVLRSRLVGEWAAAGPMMSLRMRADAGHHRLRYDDAAPAFGPAYHDTTRVTEAGARLELEHAAGVHVERTFAVGAELRVLTLESSSLEPRHVRRTDPALFTRASVALPFASLAPRLDAALRLDAWDGDWIASHELAASASLRALTATVAHRSAFSPPAASDQFFGAGFAIAPNADLRPERVPSEIEASLSAALDVGGVPVELGASAFRGDIDGMIIWAPDFRFVWSPRNHDVERSGGEAWLRASPHGALDVSAWVARARVTYDWPGDADTVQVVYRPAHTAGVSVAWRPGAWRLDADAIYTGVRYASPGHANPLPGYWDVRTGIAREWRAGPATVAAALRVERLFDNTDAFVHGYPEPGRTLTLELRVRAAGPTETTLADNR